jgi:hypothetical protein
MPAHLILLDFITHTILGQLWQLHWHCRKGVWYSFIYCI